MNNYVFDVLHNGRNGKECELYLVIDVETTMSSDTKFSAEPFDPKNTILQIGFHGIGRLYTEVYHLQTRTDIAKTIEYLNHILTKRVTSLVTFNGKFDLHYLVAAGLDIDNVCSCFDVQNMVYTMYPGKTMFSLNRTCELLGVAGKEDTVTELIKSGVLMQDIDEDLVAKYLEQDVTATEQCFLALRNEAHKEARSGSVEIQLLQNVMAKYVLALQAMEFNGLKIDVEQLVALSDALYIKRDRLEALSEDALFHLLPSEVEITKPFAVRFLNQLLFAKPIEYKVKEIVGKYKNGKDKYKLVTKSHTIPSTLNKPDFYTREQVLKENPHIGMPMGEAVLKKILESKRLKVGSLRQNYLEIVLDYRKTNKLLSTYVAPIAEYIEKTEMDYIHPTYNISITATGRSSSTNPNAQNFPKEIDKLIVPTHGKEFIFGADFKQLEVCGAAILSNDPQLIADIRAGVDIHDEVGIQAGLDITTMTKDERRDIKYVVFGTIYGGGANTLSKQSGIPVTKVIDIQAALKKRYAYLFAYYKKYRASLGDNVVGSIFKDSYEAEIAEMDSITGRRYRYEQYLNKFYPSPMRKPRPRMDFSWPQSCNYPVQGLSTGDIVPLYISLLHAQTRDDEDAPCLLSRTIHDSIESRWNYSDTGLDTTLSIAKEIHDTTISLTGIAFKEWTGTPISVPLRMSYEYKTVALTSMTIYDEGETT